MVTAGKNGYEGCHQHGHEKLEAAYEGEVDGLGTGEGVGVEVVGEVNAV